jgi:GTPase
LSFIDEAVIDVQGGRGGNGCISFRREKYVPRGGPNGGDGGHGGSVYLVGDASLNTLFHLRFSSLFAAHRGKHGEGSNKTGASASDLEVGVPLGTQVWDPGTGELLGELLEEGGRLCVAAGGMGGRGNARFATSTNRAPRRADPGREGEERRLRLELKLLADVGVVGLPNAGKSTLISTVSAARPKIADYPFTTLVPQLGVVAFGAYTTPFVIADLPGLIEGAAHGAGLGHRFLKHVERCRLLLHLVDLSGGEKSAEADLATVEHELEAYNPALLERPRYILGSKLDSADSERQAELQAAAAARGLPYREISAVTHEELGTLMRELGEHLARLPKPHVSTEPHAVSVPPALRPASERDEPVPGEPVPDDEEPA